MSGWPERLAAVIRTRELAARTLAQTLREILGSREDVSETTLRDRWLEALRSSGDVYPDGWYTPPPHGMIVLFATDSKPGRINHASYRSREAWAREEVLLDRKKGLAMLYASPVDRTTGMIGDFGVLLYFGSKPTIQEHLAHCLELEQMIVASIRSDAPLSQIAKRAQELMTERGLINNVQSITDPTGADIGHTIPAVTRGWTTEESRVFEQGDWGVAKDMISRARGWVNTTETMTAATAGVFTIEPRPSVVGRADLPAVAYHTMVVVEAGRTRWLTGFDELFKLVGMDYMPRLP